MGFIPGVKVASGAGLRGALRRDPCRSFCHSRAFLSNTPDTRSGRNPCRGALRQRLGTYGQVGQAAIAMST